MIRDYRHSLLRVAELCCVASLLFGVSCGSPHTAGSGARDAGQSAGSTAADSGEPNVSGSGSSATPVMAGRDATAGKPGESSCQSHAECRLEADYCTGCDCVALGTGENVRACSGAGVNCLVDPCRSKSALCVRGQCVAE
jgi:hypothetical protein